MTTLPTTMKAWRVHRFGGPEVMVLEDVPMPAPDAGEVLIRVAAAGVGPWDGWIRAGRSALPQPLTLGSDLSGTIAAVGQGIVDFAPGDPVYGVTNPRFTGAYAEYAVASAAMVARKPHTLDDNAAASVPVIAVTAEQALFDQAPFDQAGATAGQTVLIHGAAGNVGAYAVQLARRAGLRVIATVGAADVDRVRSLGADIIVDYGAQQFESVARDVDAVIDLVGGAVQDRSFAVLRRGGGLVSAVSEPDQAKARGAGVRAAFFLVAVTTACLTRVTAMIDAGELTTRVGVVLPFAEATVAHEMLEGARARPGGKIVLNLAS